MWPGPVVEVFNYPNVSEALGHMDRKNAEGYVIRSHNFLVKLKQPDYLDLHRLVTNCSPKTVWEQLKDGKTREEIISVFPDEFHRMVDDMIVPLLAQYVVREKEIMGVYSILFDRVLEKYGPEATRADFASVFKKHPDAGFFFKLLDNRSIREVLWASLKPTADKE